MKPGLLLLRITVSLALVPFASSTSDAQLMDFASPYTVPFADYISSVQLPAGKSLSLATMDVRISGHSLLNQNGTVSRAFVQDVSELPSFSNSTSYFVDILRAAPAAPAPAYYVTTTGTAGHKRNAAAARVLADASSFRQCCLHRGPA